MYFFKTATIKKPESIINGNMKRNTIENFHAKIIEIRMNAKPRKTIIKKSASLKFTADLIRSMFLFVI